MWEYASEQQEVAAERPAVLLHGPLGRASAWWQTVRWLVSGFGYSCWSNAGAARASDEPVQRPPGLESAFEDAKAVVDHLELGLSSTRTPPRCPWKAE